MMNTGYNSTLVQFKGRTLSECNAVEQSLKYAKNHPRPASWKDYIARLGGALDYYLGKLSK